MTKLQEAVEKLIRGIEWRGADYTTFDPATGSHEDFVDADKVLALREFFEGGDSDE